MPLQVDMEQKMIHRLKHYFLSRLIQAAFYSSIQCYMLGLQK